MLVLQAGNTQKTMTAFNAEQTVAAPRSPSRWLAAVLFLLALTGPLAIGWLTLLGCDPYSVNFASSRMLLSIIDGLLFAILGALIFVYRPHNRIGWLCLLVAFCMPGSVAADLYVQCGLTGTIAAPGFAYVAWFLYSYGAFVIVPFFFLLPMVYPTGRFLSPRWRWLTIACLCVHALSGTGLGLLPDFSRSNSMNAFAVANPFGTLPLPAWWFSFFHNMFGLSTVAQNLLTMAALVVRYRRSVGDERQQMKWLVYFLTMTLGILLVFDIFGIFFYPQLMKSVWFALVVWTVFLGFPFIIGLAIFKYRLDDIDVIINRTLVYGGLTLVVILIYILVVGGLGVLFHASGNLLISLLGAALIAVLFQPVREWLQRSVNRFMFGQRDEPYAVLAQLGRQLQTTAVPSETLASIVQTLAATLKLPYVAIELVEHDARVQQAAVGQPLGERVELPLRYQNEIVGYLLVSARSPGERFNLQEQQLLATVAAQIGPVASATRLTTALQRSRERLVMTREEERRRIRRDLHDGLGPTMASQTLKLEAVLDLFDLDPKAAYDMVAQLKGQNERMVSDIRRMVYELYPSVLDEFGLVEALRLHLAQMSGLRNGGVQLRIEASPDPLPELSAASEVAAYRIVLEGVTNVVRHAGATRCSVALAAEHDRLHICISDNGRGVPAGYHPGIGLASMQERAEELGGTFQIELAEPSGTQITAELPYKGRR